MKDTVRLIVTVGVGLAGFLVGYFAGFLVGYITLELIKGAM